MCAKQSGNILFIIVIAVALFAALSYAVTQSTRTTGSTTTEKGRLAASQIINYISGLQVAINRMMLTNQCSIEQIDFTNPNYPVQPTSNPRAPSNNTCHMFHPDGGNMYILTPKQDWLLNPTPYASHPFIDRHGSIGFHGIRNIINTPSIAAEIVVVIPYLTNKICTSLNEEFELEGEDTSYGYWMGEYLGPQNFRTSDTSNQKPYKYSCSTNNSITSRPFNALHYTLYEQ